MSEKSLDDFFAKKDKGKKGKKNKAKFTTTDEIAKNLTSGEEPRKTQKKLDKDKKNDEKGLEVTPASGVVIENPTEEWKEEDNKEVDYSDLKIQSLQVSEEAMKAESEDGEEEEFDEFGELIKSKTQAASGPWKTATDPDGTGAQPETTVAESKDEPVHIKGGVYVPPSRRSASSSAPTQSSSQRARILRGKKKAPEINCEQEFPSLAASADILKYTDKKEDRTFETVTRGGPKSDGSTARGPGLSLDNRYLPLDRN
ncbi:protein CDV3 homolog A-like [Apostichopus japonicus]|uniref:protein CDV3 homolog A-like n=1 Tax=Stichopus japonicus TaxID=307972 RepID=UPI003AB42984